MCRCKMNNCNLNNNSNIINSRIMENNMCECGFEDDSVFPENFMFGQSYVPIQRMTTTFNPQTGLNMGTMFPELVSSYCPGQSFEEDRYLRCANEIGEGCNSEL